MKTTGEAAIVYAEKKCESYYYDEIHGLLKEMCQIGFEGGVAFAQRWIPIDEELPENTNTVNVMGVDEFVCCGYYSPAVKMWHTDREIGAVIKWQPINLK